MVAIAVVSSVVLAVSIDGGSVRCRGNDEIIAVVVLLLDMEQVLFQHGKTNRFNAPTI